MVKGIWVEKNLWNEIFEAGRSSSEFGLQYLRDWPYMRYCRLSKDWITNVLDMRDIRNMRTWTPYFVVAQTGSGKTTLIFKECVPLAIKEGRKILYVAGRVSLTTQVKELAMRDEVNGEMQGDCVKVKEMKKEYSAKAIEKSNHFGAIEIYTYQELLHSVGTLNFSDYSMVIMDEAHFFMSDATFNCFTEEILNRIIEKAKDTRRIYLTATPEEVLEVIYEKEKAYLETIVGGQSELRVYVMDEDYSYMRSTFFQDEDWLIKKVKSSGDDDHWLIFVREKATGEKILQELSGISGGVVFMTADMDRSCEKYQSLIRSEELPTRVLIATKFIDVGVNIQTKNMNIVVFDDDIVEVKQMIGRKRVKKAEEVDVYFCIPTWKELKRRQACVNNLKKNEEKLISGIDMPKLNGYHDELQHPLFVCGSEVSYNTLSLKKHWMDYFRYQKLLKDLECYESDTEAYMETYKRLMLEHFPGAHEIQTVKDDPDRNLENCEQVKVLTDKWSSRTMQKEDLNQFSKELTEIVGDVRKDSRPDRGPMRVNAINKALEPYNYRVVSDNSKTPVTYRISRTGGRVSYENTRLFFVEH